MDRRVFQTDFWNRNILRLSGTEAGFQKCKEQGLALLFYALDAGKGVVLIETLDCTPFDRRRAAELEGVLPRSPLESPQTWAARPTRHGLTPDVNARSVVQARRSVTLEIQLLGQAAHFLNKLQPRSAELG